MEPTARNRKSFARAVLAVSLAALLLAPAVLLSAEDGKAKDAGQGGWVELLEGNDLSKHWDTTGNWKLESGGVVRLEPRAGEGGWERYGAYLWLKDKQYKDFEAEFDYKLDKGGNSGFYFHVGDLKQPVATGVEVQIYDSHGQEKLSDHSSGGIIPGTPPTKDAAKPAGEWNHFKITVQGTKATVELNGQKVNEVDLGQGPLKDRPASGHIGFQDHALPVWLKGIRIREL